MLTNTTKIYGEQNRTIDASAKVDSLKKVIETADHDTTKIKALNELALKFITTEPDTALELAKQALELSNTLEYTKGLIASCHNIGYVNYVQSNYEQAIANWTKTLELRESLGDKKGMAASYNNIGEIHRQQSDYPQALDYYFKSLKIYEELGNAPDEALAKAGKQGMASSYTNIGSLYTSLYETGDASSEAPIAIGAKEDSLHPDSYREAGGRDSTDHTLLDSALYYHNLALLIEKELSDEWSMCHTLSGIGAAYTQKQQYTQAIENYHQAALLADSIGAMQQASEAHLGLAGCYEELASTQGQPPSGSPLLGGESRRAKSPLNANAQKYYKLALEHYKQYSTLKDSVFNEEKSKDLGKLEAKHEFEIAEAEHKRMEKEQAKQTAAAKSRRDNLQYSGISICLILLFTTVMLFSSRIKSPQQGGRLAKLIGGVAIPTRIFEGVIFLSFLLFFEFTLVLLDPYIEQYSSGAPAIKLGFNALLAALIFPLHSLFENKLKKRITINH